MTWALAAVGPPGRLLATLACFASAAHSAPATFARALDALPPTPPATAAYAYAPGDIYPRTTRERELCARASHPDWVYLGALAVLDVGAVWFGSSDIFKYKVDNIPRLGGPAMIGLAWGATMGGIWLALPKCSPDWVQGPAHEGNVHATWPLALSLALLAGATAPIVNGIAVGSNMPVEWSTGERAAHVVVAGFAGFLGALVPYVIPPRTWGAAREIEHIRVSTDARGGMLLGYALAF
jgi:hypothetical protein